MKMKKLTGFMLVFPVILAIIFSGCNQGKTPDDKPSIVCTIFPQYDWVRQILGDRADDFNVILLLNSRIDLHNYQPSVDDIIKISACDIFIYVGGESDAWTDNVLKNAVNPDMIVINLLDALGNAAKFSELVEGMETGDHHHDDDDLQDHDESEYDEHIWLSLRNAIMLSSVIADAISSLDGKNAEKYQNNLAAYVQELSVLDAEYQRAVNTSSGNTLLFGDRFPFRYLMDDYGLHYYAVFSGCSAETEASFETIIFLVRKADELNLINIMVTESSDQSIAKTIIASASGGNQRILALDSMQSVTPGDVQSGVTYISIMESNLSVLKEALR